MEITTSGIGDILPEDVEQIAKKFKGELLISVGEDRRRKAKDVFSNAAVMKICSNKFYNRKALITAMSKVWHLESDDAISDLLPNIFILKFSNSEVMERVLLGGPWSYMNNLILLDRWRPDHAPSEYQFRQCNVWVQVHNLPPEYFDNWMATTCANTLGKLVSDRKDKDPLWIAFRFEKLPHLCHKCGILGDEMIDCCSQSETESSHRYGAWMRAEEHKSLTDPVTGKLNHFPTYTHLMKNDDSNPNASPQASSPREMELEAGGCTWGISKGSEGKAESKQGVGIKDSMNTVITRSNVNWANKDLGWVSKGGASGRASDFTKQSGKTESGASLPLVDTSTEFGKHETVEKGFLSQKVMTRKGAEVNADPFNSSVMVQWRGTQKRNMNPEKFNHNTNLASESRHVHITPRG